MKSLPPILGVVAFALIGAVLSMTFVADRTMLLVTFLALALVGIAAAFYVLAITGMFA